MKYMLMIYSNEKAWEELPEARQHQIFGEYAAYSEENEEVRREPSTGPDG